MHKYKLRMWDGLRESFDVIDYRDGDDSTSPHKLPGRTKYDGITLERGVTQDSTFANWAAAVAGSTSSGSEVPGRSFRGSLELTDEAGQPIIRYSIRGSSLSEHQLMPPGGVILHNLNLRDGKTADQKLWELMEESLNRLRKG